MGNGIAGQNMKKINNGINDYNAMPQYISFLNYT